MIQAASNRYGELGSTMQRLEQQWSLRTYEKGAIIFKAGEAIEDLFVIKSGVCRIFRVSDSGKQLTLSFEGEGSILGEGALADNVVSGSFAEAYETCVVCRIGTKAFQAAVLSDPTFATSLMNRVSRRLAEVQDLAEDMVFRDGLERFARALLRLAARHGEQHAGCLRIGIRLVQRELGMLIGTSRPTTNLLIQDLRGRGLIAHRKGSLELVDIAGLSCLANEELI